MSKLYVNELAPKTAGNKIMMPQGSIIQVQYTQYDGTSSHSITAGDNALSDLTVDITPTSASSKILLQTHVMFEGNFNDHNVMWLFMRDNTALKAPAAGSRRCGISTGSTSYFAADTASTPSMASYQYFDAPNTTDTITYKVAVSPYTSYTLYLNRTVNDTDTNDYERGISYISATEIAG